MWLFLYSITIVGFFSSSLSATSFVALLLDHWVLSSSPKCLVVFRSVFACILFYIDEVLWME